MYSNIKYYENICNCLRVIQQDINRKLKSANCWQQTSLIYEVPNTTIAEFANTEYPNEMAQYESSHLDLQYLPSRLHFQHTLRHFCRLLSLHFMGLLTLNALPIVTIVLACT